MRRSVVPFGIVWLLTAGVPTALSQTVQLPINAAEEAVQFQSESEALAEDLGLIAQSRGWTLQEVQAAYRAVEVVGRIAEEIAAERPDMFIGSVLSPLPGASPAIYIKGPADDFVLDLLGTAETQIKLVDNQPFSFEELEKRKLEVHHALVALGFRNVSTGFSLTGGGTIEASVAIEPGLSVDAAEILRNLPAEVRDSVMLTVSDRAGVDFTSFGGMWMRNTGTNVCTSGWSVQNGSGINGVTTAGHCTGINEIDHAGLIHTTVFQRQHRGQWGDVEWHTTNVPEPDDFYATATLIRDVTAVEPRANITVGESVCLYGRASNFRDCSRVVADVSEACTLDGVFNDRLVLMDFIAGAPGDSGGGWSLGSKAYGSMKGLCGADFNQAAWSVADLYDEAIGVSVLK